MKSLRKYIFKIIVITALLITSLFLKANKVDAALKTYKYSEYMKIFPNYKAIKDVDPQELYDNYATTEVDDPKGAKFGYWFYHGQIMCFEDSNTATKSNSNRQYVVIDINPSGDDPTHVDVYYKGKLRLSFEDKTAVRMAYLARQCDVANKTSRDHSWDCKHAIVNWWRNFGPKVGNALKKELDNDKIKWPTSSEKGYIDKDRFQPGLDNYAKNYQTATTVYQARIILELGGWSQGRAIVYGSKHTRSLVKVDKFVKQVKVVNEEYADLGNQLLEKNGKATRSGKKDAWKKQNAVVTKVPEVKFRYIIKLTNKGKEKVTGTLTDVFDESYLSNLEWDVIPENLNNGNDPTKKFDIEGGETKTFAIYLTGKASVTSGKYKNTATFTLESGAKASASDWVKVTATENPKIDKYITKIESIDESLASELNQDLQDERAGREKDDKEKDPVITTSGDVKIYYKIVVSNNGFANAKGKLKDTYETEFLSNLTWLETNGVKVNGKTTEEFTVKPGQKKVFEISLIGKKEVTNGKYLNHARFTSTNTKKKYDGYDYIQVGKDNVILNKYINKLQNGTLSRSRLSETDKQSNPANAGQNTEEKKIEYNVVITNQKDHDVTGTFTDSADSEVKIEGITYNGNSISSGTEITIPSRSAITITISASFKKGGDEGVYANTASFSFEDNPPLESSDYFRIKKKTKKTDQPVGILKKYVSKVTNSPGSYKGGRKDMGVSEKYSYPAEVIKGSYVTFTVEAEINVPYQNTSESGCGLPQCPTHINRHTLDWVKCTDTYDKGLTYSSISGNFGATFSNGEITWYNVTQSEDPDVKTKLTADITFLVTASNMKLMNLENNVKDLRYQYTKYDCVISHQSKHTATATDYYGNPYTYEWCDHKNCYMTHPTTVKTGSLGGNDSDYVRLLDPEIAGVVFLDKNENDLKDGTDEDLGQMSRDQYKKVTVELWNASIGLLVGETQVDPSTGYFSFGRVRKGPDRIDTGGYVSEFVNIGVGNYFYYDSEDLYTYYIVYNYDGERFMAVANAEMSNLDSSTYAMNSVFPNDSNADEINREKFNSGLETLANNIAFPNTTGEGGKVVNYETEGERLQQSIASWDGDVDSVLNMKAQSFDLFFPDGETDYLQHINLGLREREIADLALTKDVVEAEVTVNGFKTTYTFEQLGNGYDIGDDNTLTTPYILRIYREDYEYRTNKQSSEVQNLLNARNQYTSYGRTNDLEIILTYKIVVTNNSDYSDAVVREIVDYSSKEMELLPETVTLDDMKLDVSESSKYQNNPKVPDDCNVHYFTGSTLNDTYIVSGESIEVYAKYKVARDEATGYLKIDKDNGDSNSIFDGKVNVAEVGAYSFYNEEVEPAGLIDINSNPANAEVTDGKFDTSKFEDDTFATGILVVTRDNLDPNDPPENPPAPDPGLEAEKKAYRNISGIVFEEIDKSVNDNTDGQLVGDGELNGNDIEAKNVLVKLYEVVRSQDESQEYLVDTGLWYRTGEDGRYYFGDKVDGNLDRTNGYDENNSTNDRYRLHAGIYEVRFVYGDEADKLETTDGTTIRYSGQDYQSVKYTEPGTDNNEKEVLEVTAFTELSGNAIPFDGEEPSLGSTIVSVAKDNEVRRLEVNEYSTTMTYPMDTVLKAQNEQEKQLLAEHTSMFADTKAFNMNIEHIENYLSDDDKTIDATYFVTADEYMEAYAYSVRDINFGITERPKTKLQLMNDVSEIKAVTSDGNTILDVFFDIEYTAEKDSNGNIIDIKHTATINEEKSTGFSQLQTLNRSGNNQGFRYANIDSELLQGMTITVKFKIAIANTSEVDHIAGWLEDKIENESEIGIDIDYKGSEVSSASTTNPAMKDDTLVVDKIREQERTYDYSKNYLYSLLNSGDSSRSISALNKATTPISRYDMDETSPMIKGSTSVRQAYTYINIVKLAQSDYKPGYYLGNLYYYNTVGSEDDKVQTKVNQYIDYVDNDLIFKPEENRNENNQIQYLTYTTKEIAKRGLLKDVTPDVKAITDGRRDYFNEDSKEDTNNNLAFNVEDGTINPRFYKYDIPTRFKLNNTISTKDTDISNYFYEIDLQASRTLTSEIDLEGMTIDNIAEIVKVANTVGRKAYVKEDVTSSEGYIGNTTMEDIGSIERLGSETTIVEVANKETDTDFTEYVTFSPPTGLNPEQAKIKIARDRTEEVLLILIPTIIIFSGTIYVTIQVIKRKKFYK